MYGKDINAYFQAAAPGTVDDAILASLLVTAAVVEIALDLRVFIPITEARVGRPMTPASVAGVARRTTRRTVRRTTAYIATLPAGCRTVVIDGTSLHQCAGTYYQASGSQWVIVHVD